MFEYGSFAEIAPKAEGLSHDKFFKRVFAAFFKDLIELVHPRVAEALDLDRVVFRTEPLYSQLGKGEHLIPDLVASAPLKEGSGDRTVVIHLEIEAKHRASMERRMWRYFSRLSSQHDTEVFSVVVFLSGGPTGIQLRRHRSLIANVEVNRFTYWAFGLSACDAEEWLEKPQLLAKALAAMMKVRGDRVAHKLRCLRAAAQEKDPGRLYLLNLMIDIYSKLRKDEQVRFETLLAQEKAMLPEIPAHIPLSLEDYEQRCDQLIAEGQKRSIVQLIARRFGAVPTSIEKRLGSIGDPSRLKQLLDAAIDATSLSQVEAALAGV